MIRTFCDLCGEEIARNTVTCRYRPQFEANGHKVQLEVMVACDGSWNSGDLCVSCLKDVIYNGLEPEKPLVAAESA